MTLGAAIWYDPVMRTVDLEWLFERVIPEPNSGCWLWAMSVSHEGYARVKIERRDLRAHRVAYELKHGPILDGLVLDHLCRVRCCINPDHVEPVSLGVNISRGALPAITAARNRSPEMIASAKRPKSLAHRQAMSAAQLERYKSPMARAKQSRQKSPEEAAKIRAILVARNQSPEMLAVVKRPKSPEHRAAMKAAHRARWRKERT